MERQKQYHRACSLLLALLFFLLLVYSPLLAKRDCPVLIVGAGMQASNASPSVREAVLGESILYSYVPPAQMQHIKGIRSENAGDTGTQELRREIIFCVLLLIASILRLGFCRLQKYAESPPPLIQHRALMRFLKRSDGRKRICAA